MNQEKPLKRKVSRLTDYKKRRNLLKSRNVRLVLRKSNQYIQAQLTTYDSRGDLVLKTLSTREFLESQLLTSGKNIFAAYLLGLKVGKQIKYKMKVILDLGLVNPKADAAFFGWSFLKGVCEIEDSLIYEGHEPTELELSKYIEEDANKIIVNQIKS